MRRTPSGAATRQRKRMRWAPACLSALTASAAEPQVLRHLVRHEHGDLVHELLEIPGGGVLVPEDRELVLDQRVIEHGEVRELGVGHGREGTALPDEAARRPVAERARRVWRTDGAAVSDSIQGTVALVCPRS